MERNAGGADRMVRRTGDPGVALVGVLTLLQIVPEPITIGLHPLGPGVLSLGPGLTQGSLLTDWWVTTPAPVI